MPVAAVPSYLGTDFSQASPGLRFGMYLPLWVVDSRSRELLRTTHDIVYETTGDQRQERDKKSENKTAALRAALQLTKTDKDTLAALAARQQALAAPLIEARSLYVIDGRSVAPFTTGLGNEHPLENGFAFLNPYGLPYLAGSGVKGVLRQAARELASGEWGDAQEWSETASYALQIGQRRVAMSVLDVLFGRESESGEREHVRGALAFWDVIPRIEGEGLQVDVMTPHQTHYYQQADSPHESGQPNPINFLTVPPGSAFTFHVVCDRAFLQRLAPDLAAGERWQALLGAAFTHAFSWLGFGAKTAVGYGAMQPDAAAKVRRDNDARDRQAKRKAEQAAEERRVAVSKMSPTEREIAEFLDARTDRNTAEIPALINALKNGRWSGETKVAVAGHLRSLMQQARKWREKTEKKNPLKDYDHQDTLQVLKWLKGA